MFQIVLLAHALFKEAHSLRNKRFRVVSEQRNTEERRGTGFSVCPIFRVVFDSRSLSVPRFFYTVILIKDSKRDSCSGCMLFTCFFIYGFFSQTPSTVSASSEVHFHFFNISRVFIARLSKRGGPGN